MHGVSGKTKKMTPTIGYKIFLKEKHINKAAFKNYLELINARPELFTNNDLMRIETNPEIIQKFIERTGKQVGVVYESEFNIFLVDLIELHDGSMITYERIVSTIQSGAVVVIPIFQGKFVLLKQFRHAMRNIQYAFPRGFAERSKSAQENAHTEIKEEVGADILSIKHLGDVIADSGLSGNAVSVFVAEITKPKNINLSEGIQDLVYLSQDELNDWIRKQKITDGFTLSAYCLYTVISQEKEIP